MPRFLIEVDATHAGILTSARSRADSRRPFTAERNAPLPPPKAGRGFGGRLKPRYIVGAEPLDQ